MNICFKICISHLKYNCTKIYHWKINYCNKENYHWRSVVQQSYCKRNYKKIIKNYINIIVDSHIFQKNRKLYKLVHKKKCQICIENLEFTCKQISKIIIFICYNKVDVLLNLRMYSNFSLMRWSVLRKGNKTCWSQVSCSCPI